MPNTHEHTTDLQLFWTCAMPSSFCFHAILSGGSFRVKGTNENRQAKLPIFIRAKSEARFQNLFVIRRKSAQTHNGKKMGGGGSIRFSVRTLQVQLLEPVLSAIVQPRKCETICVPLKYVQNALSALLSNHSPFPHISDRG